MCRVIYVVFCVLLSVACSDHGSDAQDTDLIHFAGICDGSAAVRIGSDKLLVAYDENNSLYLYSSIGGQPEAEFPYQELLKINAKEVDIEAAAVVSDGVWWVGSHGRDGDGDVAPNRRLLFKTVLPQKTDQQLRLLQPAIDLYPILTESPLSKSFLTEKVLRKKPKKGGLNVEGLVAESDDSLLLGFRSPLTKDNHALIAQLEKKTDTFVVKKFWQLDLGNRGIRDIQRTGEDYILIAGDVDSGGVSALYRWRPDSKANVLTHLDRTLNPEALVKFKDYWLVLSDDGKMQRQGRDSCDEIAEERSSDKKVYFRAIKITDDSLADK